MDPRKLTLERFWKIIMSRSLTQAQRLKHWIKATLSFTDRGRPSTSRPAIRFLAQKRIAHWNVNPHLASVIQIHTQATHWAWGQRALFMTGALVQLRLSFLSRDFSLKSTHESMESWLYVQVRFMCKCLSLVFSRKIAKVY